MVLGIALGVVAVVLVAAYLFDRRARKWGHRVRAGWSTNRALRERRRDQKVQHDGWYRDASWVDNTQGGQIGDGSDRA